MATASIFCKKEGPAFLLETYHLINFSLGGNKKGTGGFYRRVSEQFRDLISDKRTFSVSTLGYSPCYLKCKNPISILKLL